MSRSDVGPAEHLTDRANSDALSKSGLFRQRRRSEAVSQPSPRSSASSTYSSIPQLGYRGTFICSHTTDVDLSPRASSDPGSESSSFASNMFSLEHEYVGALADQLSNMWGQEEQSKRAQEPASEDAGLELDVQGLAQRAADDAESSGQHELRIHKQEVRRHIKAEAQRRIETQQTSAKWNSVLSVIEEIPEQVELVLQTSAETITDQVKDEVEAVQTMLMVPNAAHLDPQSAQVPAAEKIQSIPTLAVEAFEASLQKAKCTVRRHVDGVIHDIVSVGELGTDHMVEQMRLLPGDLREIAGQAIEEATHEFKIQARRQIDTAIQQLPEDHLSQRRRFDLSRQAKKQIVATVPPKMPDTLHKVAKAAESTIEQAVAEIQNTSTSSQHVTNQVVADTLLRGRVDGDNALFAARKGGPIENAQEKPRALANLAYSEQTSELPPRSLLVTNPGSYGHPELCPRPCLYYASSQGCANGSSCEFCHYPHSKRPVHLDKRLREVLKAMTVPERLALINPVLRKKLHDMSLDDQTVKMISTYASNGADGSELMETNGTPLGWNDQHVSRVASSQTPNKRKLATALKAMSVRGLLVLVQKNVEGEEPQRKNDLDVILQRLRFQRACASTAC